MARPDFSELGAVQIDPELLSRGTGQPVALREAVVYDFMRPFLGNRFRLDETLRRGTHFFSDAGSFMMGEEAFQVLAQKEMAAGNLTPALEAYKRGLHKAVGFAGAISMLGDRALLSQEELDRFNLERSFGEIESGLIRMIVASGDDTKVDLHQYVQWVDRVRVLVRDSKALSGQFFNGVAKHPDNPEIKWTDPDYWDRSTVGSREVGTKLIDTYVEMQRYEDAAWIAEKLGDRRAQVEFATLAKTDPQDPRGYRAILAKIDEREEQYRYPERFRDH